MLAQLTAGKSKCLHSLSMGCLLGSEDLPYFPSNGLPCPLQCLFHPIATSEDVGLQHFGNEGRVCDDTFIHLIVCVCVCVCVVCVCVCVCVFVCVVCVCLCVVCVCGVCVKVQKEQCGWEGGREHLLSVLSG